jgi:hypothetical protein
MHCGIRSEDKADVDIRTGARILARGTAIDDDGQHVWVVVRPSCDSAQGGVFL